MRRIAVVGAGASGLSCTKSLLEEGLDVVCFEASSQLGGVWAYRAHPGGHPTAMSCTVMNSSKELSSFSDFPPPASSPNFMPHVLALDYLSSYAKHYQLDKHVKLSHRVETIRRSVDYVKTGRWDLTVLDLENGERKVTTFDAVVLCSGKHSKPRIPRFEGQEKFKGRVLHSSDYKTSEGFKDRTVLVVGIGNSGSDIAVELSGVAKKVYLSARNGSWLFGRFGKGGYPADLTMFRRNMLYLNSVLPYSWVCSYVENLLSLRVDHDLYHLKPSYRALSHYPTINDELHLKLASGLILLKGDVEYVQENSVRFKGDEENEESVDDIILATGYEDYFPFLTATQWPIREGKLELYNYIFPPEDDHHSMAFVGMVYAFGPQFPVIEMQSRWISRVFSGKATLPSKDRMISDIESNRSRVAHRFGTKSLLNGQLDWLPYLDLLAGYVGAKPNWWRMLYQDPKLLYLCSFGPAVSYMYRLEGPHAWAGARDAILGLPSRVAKPFPARGS